MHSLLQKQLAKIEKVYNPNSLIQEKQNNEKIKDYYLATRLAYLFFHNPYGFMHMGLSKGSKYKHADLLGPLNIIDSYLTKTQQQKVLELGAGNGANSSYLAKKHTTTEFLGIDLSKGPLNGFSKTPNYKQEIGDYHNLERYADNSFDVVFVIEALCHSQNKEKVLDEVYKKLKKGGYFIVFDGYLKKPRKELTETELWAKHLAEKSMAVEDFEELESFNRKIMSSGFKLEEARDLSINVLPSLERFEKLAKAFYKFPTLAKIVKLLLPNKITQNSIAGLLMTALIRENIACYYLHILKTSA